MRISDLASPTFTRRLVDVILPWLGLLTFCVLAYGLWLSFHAPDDYQQGRTVLIMFVHVPAAWLSMGIYAFMGVAAIGSLVWKHPMADVAAKAAAPLGAAFSLICLVTGSFWGRPMWGAYWVWDARLTSMLVLFLMYLGIIALWKASDDFLKTGRMVAILTLIGVINLPIIKFSVEWWNTLHQPASVIRLGGAAIHPLLLKPLIIMAIGFFLLFLTLHLSSMRNELMSRRVRSLKIRAANNG
jgi:heme exporter protein C